MILAETLSESEATRRIFLSAGALGLLGLVLLIATVWWWRSTRSDHPALARLEVLSTRRWGKASEPERARMLAKARPASDAGTQLAPEPEPVDLSILAAGDHAGFDDLREIDLMLGLHLPGALGSAGTAPATSVAPAGPDRSVEAAHGVPRVGDGSSPVRPADVGSRSAVARDATVGADAAVRPADELDAAATTAGDGAPVRTVGSIDGPGEPAAPTPMRDDTVERAAADRPSSATVARAPESDTVARDAVATAARGSVSTIAAPDGEGAAIPGDAPDVVAHGVLGEEDATSAIGADAIDPLLQRTTNPD